ncbi:c-type cytochrome [Puniceibacterium sp. IMCC21224]|uniref:c-type cytochrome n=1 Tax=Puniceibacterium sp. IMCC21224 TaxID=1618204 RepID=UPI00064DCDB5|nr:c-type cytochrome [Puniceibacterium sp. IMCC21224]KMK66156.1 sulfur dehydrogenase subunit SoxD [Puniceibacterium sp. IMCC21224]
MSRFPETCAVIAALLCSGSAMAQTYGLGRAALPEEIAAWDHDIRPDGTGLPVGSGDALTGEPIFAEKCAACHGDFAEGIGNWPKLAGGAKTLDHDDPLKTVGSYWPYVSTAVDYVKRSMPFGDAGTLSDDEVYALVAYILYSNFLIEDDFVLSNDTVDQVEMPNANGFFMDDRVAVEHALWVGEPCMTGCKDTVAVTMRARVLDVTPDQVAPTPEVATNADAAEDAAPTPDPAVIAEGEKLFRKCKACHQLGEGAKNRVGPVLTGIVGQPAGAVDGFKYSKPMIDAASDGLVWTEDQLAAFLANPRKFLKGTKMSFAGLKSEADIAALAAYLNSVD